MKAIDVCPVDKLGNLSTTIIELLPLFVSFPESVFELVELAPFMCMSNRGE